MTIRTLTLGIAMLAIGGCSRGGDQSHQSAPVQKSDMAMPASTTHENSNAAVKQAVYTCSMDPDVTSDKPGKCPKCGMDLVLKEEVPKTTATGEPGHMGQMHNH